MELNNVYNEDCFKLIKQMPDNFLDLVIVDPPYGYGIGYGSKEGDLIFDGFMGGFSTAIACHKEKRNFLGTELDAKHHALGQRKLDDSTVPNNFILKTKQNDKRTSD